MDVSKLKIGVFDIEANNWIQFCVLGFYDGEDYKTFKSPKQFLSYIDNPKYEGYRFFAHNGGRYDDLFLLDELVTNSSYELKMIASGGKLITIRVRTKKVSYTINDSYSLMPQALKRLTIAFGVKHLKGEFDFSKKFTAKNPKLLKYLKSDVFGLYECLMKFYGQEFIDIPNVTIASTALSIFSKRFCDGDLVAMNIEHEDLIRSKFYSGGRVECFKGFGKDLRYYDVNSLYPSVMLEEMPCGNYDVRRSFIKDKIGFYSVEILGTPDWFISPLLTKSERGTYYVRGRGEYYLSSTTLNYLVKEFGIRFKVNWGIVFKKREYLFNDYVEFFYKMKKNNKGNALYEMAKLALNALYGKLGQKKERESIETYTEEISRNGNFREFEEGNEYGLVLVMRNSRSRFILPYLAAYITELGRLRHFSFLNVEPKKHFYCDTDSIITQSSKLDRFVSSDIGKLGFVGEFEEGVFLNPKCYALKAKKGGKDIVKFKGFNADDYTYEEMKKAVETFSSLYFQGKKIPPLLPSTRTRILSFKEVLNKESVKKSKMEYEDKQGRFLRLVKTKKEVKSVYDKRILIPSEENLYNTIPFDSDIVNM